MPNLQLKREDLLSYDILFVLNKDNNEKAIIEKYFFTMHPSGHSDGETFSYKLNNTEVHIDLIDDCEVAYEKCKTPKYDIFIFSIDNDSHVKDLYNLWRNIERNTIPIVIKALKQQATSNLAYWEYDHIKREILLDRNYLFPRKKHSTRHTSGCMQTLKGLIKLYTTRLTISIPFIEGSNGATYIRKKLSCIIPFLKSISFDPSELSYKGCENQADAHEYLHSIYDHTHSYLGSDYFVNLYPSSKKILRNVINKRVEKSSFARKKTKISNKQSLYKKIEELYSYLHCNDDFHPEELHKLNSYIKRKEENIWRKSNSSNINTISAFVCFAYHKSDIEKTTKIIEYLEISHVDCNIDIYTGLFSKNLWHKHSIPKLNNSDIVIFICNEQLKSLTDSTTNILPGNSLNNLLEIDIQKEYLTISIDDEKNSTPIALSTNSRCKNYIWPNQKNLVKDFIDKVKKMKKNRYKEISIGNNSAVIIADGNVTDSPVSNRINTSGDQYQVIENGATLTKEQLEETFKKALADWPFSEQQKQIIYELKDILLKSKKNPSLYEKFTTMIQKISPNFGDMADTTTVTMALYTVIQMLART